MLDWLEEKKMGDWEIRHFELDKTTAALSVFSYGARAAHAGKYTGLFHSQRGVIMSDTPAEIRDLSEFNYALYKYPAGLVHIDGLGLGICTRFALEKGHPVEVVEIDQTVIDLVGTQLLARYPKQLTVIHADCLEYRPPKGTHFSIVWHDIWDTISTDNLEQYKLLNRRYGRMTDWQGSWASYELKRMRTQERRDEEFYSMFSRRND